MGRHGSSMVNFGSFWVESSILRDIRKETIRCSEKMKKNDSAIYRGETVNSDGEHLNSAN